MCGENVDLASESLDDELNVFSWDAFDGFLHDMIAILVLYTFQNINLQLLNQFGLLVGENMLQSLTKIISIPKHAREGGDGLTF